MEIILYFKCRKGNLFTIEEVVKQLKRLDLHYGNHCLCDSDLLHIVTLVIEMHYHLIFEQLLKDLSTVLLLADQTFYMPRNRSHIPTWAIAAFGACAGLLIIMALGLILVRRRERGAFKRGQSKDKSDRRWKAGFVGADYIYSHNVKSTSERRKTLAQA
ncbi:conserved hypothetical protein [Trichinella spiralis]|uniref:hypothetical protein n=1 Tax=Trichinella spiralis TaxID=6334 RepID=UPI0001EFD941|nr:conserved hypothetical protein [Trichinella spiralis]